MKAKIIYCVNNPNERKPSQVIVQCGQSENVILPDDVKNLENDKIAIFHLIGLENEDIATIKNFLLDVKETLF